jgi:hypothetical protein
MTRSKFNNLNGKMRLECPFANCKVSANLYFQEEKILKELIGLKSHLKDCLLVKKDDFMNLDFKILPKVDFRNQFINYFNSANDVENIKDDENQFVKTIFIEKSFGIRHNINESIFFIDFNNPQNQSIRKNFLFFESINKYFLILKNKTLERLVDIESLSFNVLNDIPPSYTILQIEYKKFSDTNFNLAGFGFFLKFTIKNILNFMTIFRSSVIKINSSKEYEWNVPKVYVVCNDHILLFIFLFYILYLYFIFYFN